MSFLRLRGLRHAYGDHVVLDGVDLDVARGEIVALLGPNGCGKSTLLGLLTGTLALRDGTVELDGQAIAPSDRAWRREVGVVFQSASLDGVLTATENLLLAASLHGYGRAEARERAADALRRVAMHEHAGQRVGTMSGGMRRRVDIARALLTSPRLLLMDEPTTGLDEASFRQLWDHLHEVNRRDGLTILLSTHRPDEAERSDRVAVIDEGRVAQTGSPEELRSALSPELIVLETDEPDTLAARVPSLVSLPARVSEGRVVVECEGAAHVVPRLFDQLPADTIRSLNIRRPGLADAFLKITGRSLDADLADTAP